MFQKIVVCICLLLTFTILLLGWHKAYARIGGGRSFGGKSFMSRPYSKPIPSSPMMRQQQNTAQQMQQGAATNTASRSFGGLGGIFGGLLAGTLIGSLLSGHGFSGGGFLDLILIAGLVYLAYRLFFKRKVTPDEAVNNSLYATQQPLPSGPISQTTLAGTGWESLKSGGSTYSTTTSSQPITNSTPTDFNEEEFLEGAKAAYVRLNAAWDNRDLEDIAQFTTPTFLSELKQQLVENPNPETTEIMLVNGSIVDVKIIGDEELVSVYFNVLLQENQSQETPVEIKEIWHFVRPSSGEGSWKLDGIQQVESS